MMKKLFFLCTAALLLLTGCATPRKGEVSAADKLTNRERFALYDYARSFLFNSKKLKLSAQDRRIISKKDPVTRIHYTGHKEGIAHLYWDLPGNRQIITVAEGNLCVLSGKKAQWNVQAVIGIRRRGAYDPEKYGVRE